MIRNFIKQFVVIIVLAAIIMPGTTDSLKAQSMDESFRIKLESTLYRFKNYRFSLVSMYQLKSISELAKAVKSKDKKSSVGGENTTGENGEPECLGQVEEFISTQFRNGVNKRWSQSKIEREIIRAGIDLPDKTLRDCIYNYYFSLVGTGIEKRVKNGYIVTTRMQKGQYVPNTIIGLIVSYEDDNLERNVDRPMPTDVYTYDELKQFDLDKTQFGAENLYELIMTAFMQQNVRNITLEAQGIGTFTRFMPKVHGETQSMFVNEADLTPQDVQSVMRVSQGQPIDMSFKTHEVIASPDIISWRRYEILVREDPYTGELDTISTISNKSLPKFGIELKFGQDEIGFPSLYSERMNLSAVWESVKLGVILPTSGWSSMSADAFNIERRLTHAGTGIVGQADFPMKVIKKSGVFNLNGSYVLGDAEAADYKNRIKLTNENFVAVYNGFDEYQKFDYLIRAHGQLHYTFGLAIDSDYLMRFGLGGTIYNVEKWTYQESLTSDNIDFVKNGQETIGGLSGKVEFMAKNVTTPYGASLQYFDEGLSTHIWLQIPVIDNTFAINLDVKGSFSAFRSEVHPWENESVFIPMARAIVFF